MKFVAALYLPFRFIRVAAWLGVALLHDVRAATLNVEVSDFQFFRNTVTIQPEDTVRWRLASGSHTVTSGGSCTPDGRFDFALQGVGPDPGFTFADLGTYFYFCRHHCALGMTGKVVVSTSNPPATELTDPIPGPVRAGAISVQAAPIASGLTAPNWGISAPGEPGRLFVADQIGTVWTVDLSSQTKSVFADFSRLLIRLGVDGVGSYDERGLLGLAFHPDYRLNGLLYTHTSESAEGVADFSTLGPGIAADHHSVIREWRVNAPGTVGAVVDPDSSRTLMRIDQPQFNHNGGGLIFGIDGLLYISTGDGGGADDQGVGHGQAGNAQDLGNVLGKILRIDPRRGETGNAPYRIPEDNPFIPRETAPLGGRAGCADGRCDEIYAYGFRNPFRLSFDRSQNDLWASDVGQNQIEEVDVVRRGGNYGWRHKEGSFCFDPKGDDAGVVTDARSCGPAKLQGPVAQYDHDEGVAVIGGFVYRGRAIPSLRGRYVFGDYNGRLFYLVTKNLAGTKKIKKSRVVELLQPGGERWGLSVLGFGQDATGELYVLGNQTGLPSGTTGVVLKIVP